MVKRRNNHFDFSETQNVTEGGLQQIYHDVKREFDLSTPAAVSPRWMMARRDGELFHYGFEVYNFSSGLVLIEYFDGWHPVLNVNEPPLAKNANGFWHLSLEFLPEASKNIEDKLVEIAKSQGCVVVSKEQSAEYSRRIRDVGGSLSPADKIWLSTNRPQ